jgi:hypothetical protein
VLLHTGAGRRPRASQLASPHSHIPYLPRPWSIYISPDLRQHRCSGISWSDPIRSKSKAGDGDRNREQLGSLPRYARSGHSSRDIIIIYSSRYVTSGGGGVGPPCPPAARTMMMKRWDARANNLSPTGRRGRPYLVIALMMDVFSRLMISFSTPCLLLLRVFVLWQVARRGVEVEPTGHGDGSDVSCEVLRVRSAAGAFLSACCQRRRLRRWVSLADER